MSTLHQQLEALASAFAHDVIAALRGASLEEILGEQSAEHRAAAHVATPRPARRASGRARPASARGKKKVSGRLHRRSPAQINGVVTQIVSLLKGKKAGMRAEQIQAALHLHRKEMPKPIAVALSKKLIRRKGEKRATTYYAA